MLFHEWLEKQRERQDRVGRLARELGEAPEPPVGVRSEQDLISFMEGRGAHADALEAAAEAWTEFGESATEYVDPDRLVDFDEEEENRRRG